MQLIFESGFGIHHVLVSDASVLGLRTWDYNIGLMEKENANYYLGFRA